MSFASALSNGSLDLDTPLGTLQARLQVATARLGAYRDVLRVADSVTEVALALASAAETARAIAKTGSAVEVAWTYPGVTPPGLRTTVGVAREIIDNCQKSLLVVGYSVSVDWALAGLAAEVIDAVSRAAQRGVVVTIVLNRDVKPEGFMKAWRADVRPPSFFTWPMLSDDKATIHAKLLIADRTNGLVTSANLTYHGFAGNLEMGLHVVGQPAADIHDRFYQLIAEGDLKPSPT